MSIIQMVRLAWGGNKYGQQPGHDKPIPDVSQFSIAMALDKAQSQRIRHCGGHGIEADDFWVEAVLDDGTVRRLNSVADALALQPDLRPGKRYKASRFVREKRVEKVFDGARFFRMPTEATEDLLRKIPFSRPAKAAAS